MKTFLYFTSTVALFLLATPILLANKKHPVHYQTGKIILQNGHTQEGMVAIKKSHGEDMVLFMKTPDSEKKYQYGISDVHSFTAGKQYFEVNEIKGANGRYVTALMEVLTTGDVRLYKASYYAEVQQGKNNSSLKHFETHYIRYQGDYVALSGKDFKKVLTDLWADEQAYLETIHTYEKIGPEELQEILLD